MSHPSWGRVTHIAQDVTHVAQDLYIGSSPRQHTVKTRNNAKIHPLCQQQRTNNLALIQLCAEGKLAFISYFQTMSLCLLSFYFLYFYFETVSRLWEICKPFIRNLFSFTMFSALNKFFCTSRYCVILAMTLLCNHLCPSSDTPPVLACVWSFCRAFRQ